MEFDKFDIYLKLCRCRAAKQTCQLSEATLELTKNRLSKQFKKRKNVWREERENTMGPFLLYLTFAVQAAFVLEEIGEWKMQKIYGSYGSF